MANSNGIADLINSYIQGVAAGGAPGATWPPEANRAPAQQDGGAFDSAVRSSPLYQKLDDARRTIVDRVLNSGLARYLMQTPVLDAEVQGLKQAPPARPPELPANAGPIDVARWLRQAVPAGLGYAADVQGGAVNYLNQNLPAYGNPGAQHPAPQSFTQLPGVSPAVGSLADLAVTGAAAAGMPQLAGVPGLAFRQAPKLAGRVESAGRSLKEYDSVKRAQQFASDLRRELGSTKGLEHLPEDEFVQLTKMMTRMAARPHSTGFLLERLGVAPEDAQRVAQKVAKMAPQGIGNGTLADALDVYDPAKARAQAAQPGSVVSKLFEGMTPEEANQVFNQVADEGRQVGATLAGRMTERINSAPINSVAFHELINNLPKFTGKPVSEFDANALDAAFKSLQATGKPFTLEDYIKEADSLGAGRDASTAVAAAWANRGVMGPADAMKDIVMPQRLASGEQVIRQNFGTNELTPAPRAKK
jgi:hypothetical protein